MSISDVEKLKICCQKLNMSESDILRIGIDKVYRELEIVSKELSITKSEVVRNGIDNEYQKAIGKK